MGYSPRFLQHDSWPSALLHQCSKLWTENPFRTTTHGMKVFILVLTSALFTVSALADPPVDISSLPAAVQQTINNSKGQGDVKKVKTTRVDGQIAYEVEYKEKGNDKQMLIAQDGTIIGDQKGQGYAKGKGKGKAKGHNKQSKESQEPATQPVAQQVPTPAATPAPAASQPTAATVPATPAPAAKPAPTPATPAPAQSTASASSPAKTRSATEVRTELGMRISRINTLDNNEQMARAGLTTISKETGVSVATLQAQLKEYPVGSGGLLVCNELAKATRKPASTFLKQRLQNRDWDRIAAENKFDLSSVLPKLDRVQAAMEATRKATKK